MANNLSKIKKLSAFLSMAFLFTLTISCSKDKKNECNYENAGIEFYKVLNLFQTSPVTSNCENLKSAAEKYYNAAKDCPDFNNSTEKNTVIAWMAYDCSDEIEDRNGQIVFWTSNNVGTITVSINDENKNITQTYTSSPTCSSIGVAVFKLPVGTYAYTASAGTYGWSGNISITANGCQNQQLQESEAQKTEFAGTYYGEYSFLGLLNIPDTLIITNTTVNKISVSSKQLKTSFTAIVNGATAAIEEFSAPGFPIGLFTFTDVNVKSGKLTLKNNTDLTVVLEGVDIGGASGDVPPALAGIFPVKNQRISTAKTFKKQ